MEDASTSKESDSSQERTVRGSGRRKSGRQRGRGGSAAVQRERTPSGNGSENDRGDLSLSNRGAKRSGRYQSANHLLNFSYETTENRGRGSGRRSREHSRSSYGSTYQHYDSPFFSSADLKERYIQANFRFVMNCDDSTTHRLIRDPDSVANWEDLEHIVFSTQEAYNCPICLSAPIAAKMTRCGHIYCWHCLLHYFKAVPVPISSITDPSLTVISNLAIGDVSVDEKFKKCPMCQSLFSLEAVKSVELVSQHKYAEGDWCEMKLIKARKGLLIPIPVESWTEEKQSTIPLYDDPNAVFSRFNRSLNEFSGPVGSDSYHDIRLSVLFQEAIALKAAKSVCADDETPWLDMCIEMVDRLQVRLVDLLESKRAAYRAVHEQQKEEETSTTQETASESTDEWDKKDEESAVTSSVAPSNVAESWEDQLNSSDAKSKLSAKSAPFVPSVRLSQPTGEKQSLYNPNEVSESDLLRNYLVFYQENSGERAFLHPLCLRALLTEYGGYSNLPERIGAKIGQVEEITVNEETRRRYKFLAHLPLSCVCKVFELDMDRLVKPESIAPVKDKLDERRKAREKSAQEKEQERQKELEREDRLRKQRKKMDSIGSVSSEYYPSLSESETTVSPSPADAPRWVDPSAPSEADSDANYPSLAPKWVSNASSSAVARALQSRKNVAPTFTGKVVYQPSPSQMAERRADRDANNDDEWEDIEEIPPPSDLTDYYAIDFDSHKESISQSPTAATRKQGKKGKKKNFVVLQSTTRRYQ